MLTNCTVPVLEEPVSFALATRSVSRSPNPLVIPSLTRHQSGSVSLQPALSLSVIVKIAPSPPASNVNEDGRSHVAAFAADCSIVNDFEYVPLPSVLVPVTVIVPTRSEEVVFCAKVTLTEED